jgi:predicted MFS family arabinose efflux permease
MLTFIVFPAVTFDANLKMLANLNNSNGWFVVGMNTVFSVFDTIGRKMGGYKFFDLNPTSVKVLSASRSIFIVTFYLTAF